MLNFPRAPFEAQPNGCYLDTLSKALVYTIVGGQFSIHFRQNNECVKTLNVPSGLDELKIHQSHPITV